jgi:hypothetical protein
VEGLLDLELGLAPGAPPLDGHPGRPDETLPATVSRRVIDRTDHAPGVALRPQRTALRGIVVHRIGDAEDAPVAEGRDVEGIIAFFTTNPEGVATVTVEGSWESKVPLMEKWRLEGIPESYRARAFVPYAFVIDPRGVVSQLLPLQAVGAHAPAYNHSGIGVAFIGDFRTDAPTLTQLEGGIAVCIAILRQHHLTPATVKILGHDAVRSVPKLCPGPNFPLAEVQRRISAAF